MSDLQQLEDEFLDTLLDDGNPQVGDYLARCPESAEELRRRLELIVLMHGHATEVFGDERADDDANNNHDGEVIANRAARRDVFGDEFPRQIGRFVVEGIAGRGAFGVVFKAHDPTLGRCVAIKVPHAGVLGTAEERERFLREARSAALLRHPHIVPVFEIGHDEYGVPFIVSDFIDGTTLADAAARSPLMWHTSAKLVADVADALALAHSQKIVHRDIKPGNILVTGLGGGGQGSDSKINGPISRNALASGSETQTTPEPDASAFRLIGSEKWEGEAPAEPRTTKDHGSAGASPSRYPGSLTPFLTDFGLARIGSESSTLTSEGQLLGTPAYMSPEQAAGLVDELDARTDVYSLGVVLYELLTGEPPFRGNPRAVIQQLLAGEPRAPRTLDDRIPRDLETICLKAMSKEAHRRYRTAREFADDLGRFLNGEPIRARRVGPIERTWSWCRRNRLIASLLVTVCGLLIAVAVVSMVGYWRESAIRAQAERRRESAEAFLGSLVQMTDRKDSPNLRLWEAERRTYQLAIEAADQAIRLGNVERAKQILHSVEPNAEELDRRGWEWYWLSRVATRVATRVANEPDLTTRLPIEPAAKITWHPDGTRLEIVDRTDARGIRGSRVPPPEADAREPHAPQTQQAMNPDGHRLATAAADGIIRLWHVAATSKHEANVAVTAPRDEPESLCGISADECCRLCDVPSLNLCALRFSAVKQSGFTAEERRAQRNSERERSDQLITRSSDGYVLAELGSPVISLTWNGTGEQLAALTDDGAVHVWSIADATTAVEPWTRLMHNARVEFDRGDVEAARRLCLQIGRDHDSDARDARTVRSRLTALLEAGRWLRQHNLLADAIAIDEQILQTNVSRMPPESSASRTISETARRINATVERLLTEIAKRSHDENRRELDRLVEQLFPHGRSEWHRSWRSQTHDSFSPVWQIGPTVIEFARATGELPRLIAEWEQSPFADSVEMLALRAEANGALRDRPATERLLKRLPQVSHDAEPLPLWSEACLLEPRRGLLKRQAIGFDAFEPTAPELDRFVRRDRDSLRITIPADLSEMPQVGLVTRQPLRGDFEISWSYEFHDLQLQPTDRIAGLFAQLDLLEGGEVFHIGRVLDRDAGDQIIVFQKKVSRDRAYSQRLWGFPQSPRQGRMAIARQGTQLRWFFAESDAAPLRLIHTQRCTTHEVSGLSLFVDYRHSTSQSPIDVTCRDLTIRVER